ncbi:MAG: prefoldin subunit alpha [Candidatus Micrarchaeaceae archaeon]
MATGEGNRKNGSLALEELRYLQQLYQNQYALLGNSINAELGELQELNSAQRTLEGAGMLEGKDVLNPIGGGIYFQGRISDPKNVLVGVGAGYVVEMEVDPAKTYVAELIKKRTDGLNRLTKNRKELEAALVDISYNIESSRQV